MTSVWLSVNKQSGVILSDNIDKGLGDTLRCWRDCNDETILFQGDIYNVPEVARKLGCEGDLDVQQCLRWAYRKVGYEFLSWFDGSFLVAVLDPNTNRIICGADPLGSMHLYFSEDTNHLLLDNDLLKVVNGRDRVCSLNHQAIYNYYHFNGGAIAPETFYDGINVLPVGHCMVVDGSNFEICPTRYFSFGSSTKQTASDEELCNDLGRLIKRSVSNCINNQGRVGFAVSGGLDSAVLAAIGSKNMLSDYDIDCFSISVDSPDYDESIIQSEIVNAIGGKHYNKKVSSHDVRDNIAAILDCHCEPFTPTAIGRWFLYQLVSNAGYNNLIEGWGADQLFGGYAEHHNALVISLFAQYRYREWWNELTGFGQSKMRSAGISAIKGALISINGNQTANLSNWIRSVFASRGDNLLQVDGSWDSYVNSIADNADPSIHDLYFDEHMSTSLLVTSLPFSLSTNSRNACAHNIKTIFPFLSMSVARFALALPHHLIIHNGVGKIALRQAMQQELPGTLTNKVSKRGLEIPIGSWLRGDLKFVMERLLDVDAELVSTKRMHAVVSSFLAGDMPYNDRIWRMFIIVYFEHRLRGIDLFAN